MAYDPFISHSRNSSSGNIEPRNPHFVGRETELTQLQKILAQESFCILAGAREGVGTTALAVEYAHRFAEKYDGGCRQLHCESGEPNLAAILAAIHYRPHVSETPRLLVLDNVVQPELVRLLRRLVAGVDWLDIIITTGLKEEVSGDAQDQTLLRIEGLPQQDVLALIESFQPNRSFASANDQRAAEQLASLLDGLTLSAAVAAASINYFGTSQTLPQLVERLSEVATGLNDRGWFDSQSEQIKTVRQDRILTEILRFILAKLSAEAEIALLYAASSCEHFELAKIREFVERHWGELKWPLLISALFGLGLWQPTNEVDEKGELRTARMHSLLARSIKRSFVPEIETSRDSNESAAGAPARTTGKEVSQAPHPLDDNVMFTVYRRKTIAPNKWYPLLAFAHLSERRPDAPPDEPDPAVEVKRQAQALLGGAIANYKESSEDSSQPIPKSGELMFKPFAPGVEFNPPSRIFKWEEPVHREEFKMRATNDLEGQVTRGWLRVFLGPLIVAEVNLTFKVDSNAAATDIAPDLTEHARRFRKVFASYSHKDKAIVEHIEKLVRESHLGLEYLRDVTKLRSGDVWDPKLLEMIDTADLFQLFWSTNSMGSEYVKREYDHALARQLPDFVRPVYWEKPFPEQPEAGLPPAALKRLHFEELSIAEEAGEPSVVLAKKRIPPTPAAAPGKKQEERREREVLGRTTLRRGEEIFPSYPRAADLPESLQDWPDSAGFGPPSYTLSPSGSYDSDLLGIGPFMIIGSGIAQVFLLVIFFILKYFGRVPRIVTLLIIACSILFFTGLIVSVIKWIRDR